MDVVKTVDMTLPDGQMLKPKELIEIRGTGPLTLADRRTFNVLLNNAWGKNILLHQHSFTISTTDLKHDAQQTNA